MAQLVDDDILAFLTAVAPDQDPVQAEMDEYARANGFPHIGPVSGAILRLFARMVGAHRIFEFGSGYGYSAYWFAGALPSDGEIVLTEVDEDELDMAREFIDRGAFACDVHYELGDAIETIDDYPGPFDGVLIDNEKDRYVDAFEAVRDKVSVGGFVVADNAMTAGSVVDFDDLHALTTGGDPSDVHDGTRGIYEYLETVRADPAFETVVLPVGSGLAVSVKLA